MARENPNKKPLPNKNQSQHFEPISLNRLSLYLNNNIKDICTNIQIQYSHPDAISIPYQSSLTSDLETFRREPSDFLYDTNHDSKNANNCRGINVTHSRRQKKAPVGNDSLMAELGAGCARTLRPLGYTYDTH